AARAPLQRSRVLRALGRDDVEDDAARSRGLVCEDVGCADVRDRPRRRILVPGVHLGERLALSDGLAPLAEATDADGVVDRIVLRPPAGAEVKGCDADRGGAERFDVPCTLGEDL